MDGTASTLVRPGEPAEVEEAPDPDGGGIRWLLGAVFALSTAAGVVHLALTEHHFAEWWVAGVFFGVVAIAQLGFAVLVLLPTTRSALAVLGVLGNLAVVGTYVMSRTTGVPVGWHAWTPEEVGVLDLGTTVAELALICCLLALVPARLRPWLVNLLFGCALLAVAMRLAGLLT